MRCAAFVNPWRNRHRAHAHTYTCAEIVTERQFFLDRRFVQFSWNGHRHFSFVLFVCFFFLLFFFKKKKKKRKLIATLQDSFWLSVDKNVHLVSAVRRLITWRNCWAVCAAKLEDRFLPKQNTAVLSMQKKKKKKCVNYAVTCIYLDKKTTTTKQPLSFHCLFKSTVQCGHILYSFQPQKKKEKEKLFFWPLQEKEGMVAHILFAVWFAYFAAQMLNVTDKHFQNHQFPPKQDSCVSCVTPIVHSPPHNVVVFSFLFCFVLLFFYIFGQREGRHRHTHTHTHAEGERENNVRYCMRTSCFSESSKINIIFLNK